MILVCYLRGYLPFFYSCFVSIHFFYEIKTKLYIDLSLSLYLKYSFCVCYKIQRFRICCSIAFCVCAHSKKVYLMHQHTPVCDRVKVDFFLLQLHLVLAICFFFFLYFDTDTVDVPGSVCMFMKKKLLFHSCKVDLNVESSADLNETWNTIDFRCGPFNATHNNKYCHTIEDDSIFSILLLDFVNLLKNHKFRKKNRKFNLNFTSNSM